ncbi:MAG: SDR family NAD(P)-dependent oxidoreductase, partial [Luteimonas sp.]
MSASAPVVLVTGAARRIGAAIARRLHADGYSVALHCNHSRDDADALAGELDAQRADSTLVLQGDLADAALLPTLIADTVARFGRLDALVNNAAAFAPTSFDATGADAFDALMATNARAPFLLAQAAAPHLRERRGAIVNIGD